MSVLRFGSRRPSFYSDSGVIDFEDVHPVEAKMSLDRADDNVTGKFRQIRDKMASNGNGIFAVAISAWLD